MKLNDKTALLGEKVALVPYKRHHVDKYHSWMQQTELQEQTGSEPLSLVEEYEMQETWQTDEAKLTFIILDLAKWRNIWRHFDEAELCCNEGSWSNDEKCVFQNENVEVKKYTDLENGCMIGDVNLFRCAIEWCDSAEISVMIAEAGYRRRGLATEAVQIMLQYAMERLLVSKFIAKIGMRNQPSIAMFQEKLDFQQIGNSNVFNEITLEHSTKTSTLKGSKSLFKEIEYSIKKFSLKL